MNNITDNEQESLKEFIEYVEKYRKIEEEYQSLSMIRHEKKDSLLWELDYLRDEISSLKLHLEGLIRKKDSIIKQINNKDLEHQKEKDKKIADLITGTDDITYNVSIQSLLSSLLDGLYLSREDVTINVSVDVNAVYGDVSHVSDYLLAIYYKHGYDYTENIPIMFYIEPKNSTDEPIILEWFCPLNSLQLNGEKLIDSIKTEHKISNLGSDVTKLVYDGDYNDLIIPCQLKDIFYDGLNFTNENPQYDALVRNSLITAITETLKKENNKKLVKSENNNA